MLRRFLYPEAFRAPQFVAAAMLLAYLLQCVWLVHVQTEHALAPDSDRALRIYQGLEQWKNGVGSPPKVIAFRSRNWRSAYRARRASVR